MIDNVAARSVSSAVAEPLLAQVAHNHAVGLVDAAVLTSIIGQLLPVEVALLVIFLELQLS